MIKLLLLLPLLFSACFNKRGISTHYYNSCKEYYDYRGNYHKVCDENEILETKTITDMQNFFDEEESTQEQNVW